MLMPGAVRVIARGRCFGVLEGEVEVVGVAVGGDEDVEDVDVGVEVEGARVEEGDSSEPCREEEGVWMWASRFLADFGDGGFGEGVGDEDDPVAGADVLGGAKEGVFFLANLMRQCEEVSQFVFFGGKRKMRKA